jgi:tRNA A37 threonylcarbamoyladenosine synthetase subunit TsaC/SUA5/YrdC
MAKATLGIGFVDKTDVTLVAPSINLSGKPTISTIQTAAFAFGFGGGLMFQTGERWDVFTSARVPLDERHGRCRRSRGHGSRKHQ